ncbi:glutathione S-transferase [Herminiimonas sp. KBW02]|uniref:glutathione S-transferase family protein n=1 Tax=Herminiimonas sp. KBW02 TaxID=2153363 RepID=UPI000F5994DC|nr:glutathione S-transferase [Herminiimonas sp. KBW02]RQO34028.1 glutathione S-transferase [Herminiimonas sp. KBW02]
MSTPGIKLYGVTLSGHCHRVALFLNLLNIPFEAVNADAALRASADFRQLNPLGQIPVLCDGDLVLSDSNAILVYLAKRYAAGSLWLPEDAIGAAQVQRWLSIAAGELRYGPANARIYRLWKMGKDDPVRAAEIGHDLLAFMEQHLATRHYLATDHPSIADLACHSYVAHAPEGGIPLDQYPAVRAWLARIEQLPGFVAMPRSAIPEAA